MDGKRFTRARSLSLYVVTLLTWRVDACQFIVQLLVSQKYTYVGMDSLPDWPSEGTLARAVSKREVMPPDQELHTILPTPSVFHHVNEVFFVTG